ncbi:class I SAM-dependent methyltransferase [Roseomonas rosulenta]|uniref:class I SAM-dependent methyltransferase n=1 Tax=Roseomonas rosulenta TaxID=2748667 RepID=UPI0018DF8D05
MAYNLRRHLNFSTAYPFDWWITPTRGLIALLEAFDVERLYDTRLLARDWQDTSVRSIDYGVWLHHEFPREWSQPGQPVAENFRDLTERPRRRTEHLVHRFRAMDRPGERILFVREVPSEDRGRDGTADAAALADALRARFAQAEFVLLVVNGRLSGTAPGVIGVEIPEADGGDWRGDVEAWGNCLARLGIRLAPGLHPTAASRDLDAQEAANRCDDENGAAPALQCAAGEREAMSEPRRRTAAEKLAYIDSLRADWIRELEPWSTGPDAIFVNARLPPPHLLERCRFVSHRYELVDRHLPKGGRIAEVGSMHGTFAKWLLESARPRELHIVDRGFKVFDHAHFQPAIEAGQVVLREGDSSTILKSYPPEFFDWIYIDADHSYEGVRRDIAAAVGCVKSGGFLVFNDYCCFSHRELLPYGVMRAVNEFAIDHNWRFEFFAWQEQGHFDVALRAVPGSMPA